jgi:SAM-dependent methyltransferase
MPDIQMSFFPDPPAASETDILSWIIKLHNHNEPFDLDVTYSTGRMWRELKQPKYKTDLVPQTSDTIQADARNLPFADSSMTSIAFDPPFVIAPRCAPGIVRDRFSCYKNIPELWQFYRDALWEFKRVLAPDGIVAMKCMDIVSGGTNYMTHALVIMLAQQFDLYVKDLFVLGRQNVLFSPNMANQQHARKNHCYYLVLQKSGRPGFLNRSAIMPFVENV